MKTRDFNTVYKKAEKTIVEQDELFASSGWFWINLTEKQHKKIYKLMLLQGSKEVEHRGGTGIMLVNGLIINRL